MENQNRSVKQIADINFNIKLVPIFRCYKHFAIEAKDKQIRCALSQMILCRTGLTFNQE